MAKYKINIITWTLSPRADENSPLLEDLIEQVQKYNIHIENSRHQPRPGAALDEISIDVNLSGEQPVRIFSHHFLDLTRFLEQDNGQLSSEGLKWFQDLYAAYVAVERSHDKLEKLLVNRPLRAELPSGI